MTVLRPGGRTALVTGAGRGLGLGVARVLAAEGHHVIVTTRSDEQGEAVISSLRAALPGASLERRRLDLGSFASIRALSQALVDEGRCIDMLVNNAGVMQQSPQRRLTVEGLEETLAINAVAPYLLTHTLLPALERSTSARVVCVSSRLHYPGSRGEPVRFDFEDPWLERGYHPERAYKNSKLALLWLTYELARRLRPRAITACALCPGFVPETAAESVTGAMRFVMKHVLTHMPFAVARDVAEGNIAWVASAPEIEGKSGLFFTEREAVRSSEESYDEAKAARFYELCAAVTGEAGLR